MEGAAATMSGGAPRTGRRARSRTDGHTKGAGEGEEGEERKGRGGKEAVAKQTLTGNTSGLERTAVNEEFARQASRLPMESGTHARSTDSHVSRRVMYFLKRVI